MQLEGLVRDALSRRSVITVGPGTARWANIHITDVSALWVLLVGRAINNHQHAANDGIWGTEGYYFVEGGEHVSSEFCHATPPHPIPPAIYHLCLLPRSLYLRRLAFQTAPFFHTLSVPPRCLLPPLYNYTRSVRANQTNSHGLTSRAKSQGSCSHKGSWTRRGSRA